MKCGGVAEHEGHGRPYKQRAHDEPFAVDTVGYDAGDGAAESVDPHECGHYLSKHDGRFKVGDVDGHRGAHRREHLAVHIVE